MAFKKKFAPRRKFCRFCADADLPLDYKRPDILRDYITGTRQDHCPAVSLAPAPSTSACSPPRSSAPVRWLCCSTPPAIPLT